MMRLLLFAALFFLCAATAPAKTFHIVVIPAAMEGEETDALHAGMIKAARMLAKDKTPVEVDIAWIPVADAAHQAAAVQGVLASSSRPDGLIVSPIDPAGLRQAVEGVARAGVPVVVVETPLSSPLISGYVGSNHYEAGQAAANLLCKLMKEKGGVLIVGDPARSEVVSQLEKGFINGLFSFPNVQPLFSGDYAADLPVVAPDAVAAVLRKDGARLGGVFIVDTGSYARVHQALQDGGFNVPQVVYGTRRALVDALHSGEISGLIADTPFEIGNRAVEVLVATLSGQNVPMRNTILGIAITAEKLDDPAVQAFLKPPVGEFLVK